MLICAGRSVDRPSDFITRNRIGDDSRIEIALLALRDWNLDIVKHPRDLFDRRRALTNELDRFVAQR
jgi:hypothetical protein